MGDFSGNRGKVSSEQVQATPHLGALNVLHRTDDDKEENIERTVSRPNPVHLTAKFFLKELRKC